MGKRKYIIFIPSFTLNFKRQYPVNKVKTVHIVFSWAFGICSMVGPQEAFRISWKSISNFLPGGYRSALVLNMPKIVAVFVVIELNTWWNQKQSGHKSSLFIIMNSALHWLYVFSFKLPLKMLYKNHTNLLLHQFSLLLIAPFNCC